MLVKLKQIDKKYLYGITFIGLLTALYMLIHGLSPTPNFGQLFQITQDITTSQLEPKHHWLEQSFLFPVVAYLSGFNYSIEGYFVFLTINIFLTLAGIGLLLAKMFSGEKAAFLTMVLMSSSATITLSYWIGYSDPFTLLYGTILVLVIHHANQSIAFIGLLAVVSFFAAIAHFAQTIIVLALVLLVSPSLSKNKLFIAGLSLLGLSIGQFVLQLYFDQHNFIGMSRLEYLVTYDVVEAIKSFNANRIDFMISIFRFGWPIIFYYLYIADQVLRLRFLIAFSIVLLISTVAFDHSRVASILAWPLLLSASNSAYDSFPKKTWVGPIAALLVCLSLLYPANHVWEDKSHSSPLTSQAYSFGQNILVKFYTNTAAFIDQPIIPLNTEIKFNDRRLEFHGWSAAERHHRWSLGESSSIYFYLDDEETVQGNFKLQVRSLGRQDVNIELNGVNLRPIVVNPADDIITINFSPSILSPDKNKITFFYSNPHAPNDQDKRQLALSMKWIMVE